MSDNLKEQDSWIEIIVHHPDGKKETHNVSYFVGAGIPLSLDEELPEGSTAATYMKIGRSNIYEQMTVNKVLSENIDPILTLMERSLCTGGKSEVVKGEF